MSFKITGSKKYEISPYLDKIKNFFSKIIIDDFKKSILEMDWVKEFVINKTEVLINITIPTFALRGERDCILNIKKFLIGILGKGRSIKINVYSDVRPSIKQSLIKKNICNVKNIILIASGKGGVGKSTIAANLSVFLSNLGCKVGLLDADIYGPSLPMLFDIKKSNIKAIKLSNNKLLNSSNETYMVPHEKYGIKLISVGFLVDSNSAMVWRGPMIASACIQFFYNVAWGDLDYLIVDLPPGTGDIQLAISQKVSVAGSIIVSTPQKMSVSDVIRAKSMFDNVSIRILGIVENMSYFLCENCNSKHEIFPQSKSCSGLNKLGLDVLGKIPLQTSLSRGSGNGLFTELLDKNNIISSSFMELSHIVATKIAITADGYESKKKESNSLNVL